MESKRGCAVEERGGGGGPQNLFKMLNVQHAIIFFFFLSCCRQEVEVESTETTKTTPEIKEKTVEDVKAKKEEASFNFFPYPAQPHSGFPSNCATWIFYYITVLFMINM